MRILLVAVTVALLGPAGTATAAPTWLAPQTISAGAVANEDETTAVAVTPGGDTTAVWLEGGPRRISAAFRRAGGAWTPLGPIEQAGPDAQSPQVFADERGVVLVAWRQNATLWVATRSGSGGWSGPQGIATAVGQFDAAVAADGSALLGWLDGSGGVHLRERTPGGVLGEEHTVPGGGAFFLAVARGASRRVARDVAPQRSRAAERPAGRGDVPRCRRALERGRRAAAQAGEPFLHRAGADRRRRGGDDGRVAPQRRRAGVVAAGVHDAERRGHLRRDPGAHPG